MEKIIKIAEDDLMYINSVIELGKDSFFRQFHSLNEKDKNIVFRLFYTKKLMQMLKGYNCKYFSKERKIEAYFSFKIKTIFNQLSKTNGEFRKIEKEVSLRMKAFTLENFKFTNNLFSFDVLLPDYHNEIKSLADTWTTGRGILNFEYVLEDERLEEKNYWISSIDAFDFQNNIAFNMVSNGLKDELLSDFINFLYKQKLSIVDLTELEYLKTLYDNANDIYPIFASKSFREKLEIMYHTAFHAYSWCDKTGGICSTTLLAKILFEVLRRENCVNKMLLGEELLSISHEKTHSNGELVWAIYENPKSKNHLTDRYFHALELWNNLAGIM